MIVLHGGYTESFDIDTLHDNDFTVISFPSTEQEANIDMKRYLEEIGFKSYYTRVSAFPNGVQWKDYGSHSMFFYVVS